MRLCALQKTPLVDMEDDIDLEGVHPFLLPPAYTHMPVHKLSTCLCTTSREKAVPGHAIGTRLQHNFKRQCVSAAVNYLTD